MLEHMELSDAQVLALCDRMMTDDDQTEMSQLLEQHRESLLTEVGQQRLDALMQIYRTGMVQKAEAWKIAVDRGLAIVPQVPGSALMPSKIANTRSMSPGTK
jgi:DNA polymerase/3'-5' exonuclease PolX